MAVRHRDVGRRNRCPLTQPVTERCRSVGQCQESAPDRFAVHADLRVVHHHTAVGIDFPVDSDQTAQRTALQQQLPVVALHRQAGSRQRIAAQVEDSRPGRSRRKRQFARQVVLRFAQADRRTRSQFGKSIGKRIVRLVTDSRHSRYLCHIHRIDMRTGDQYRGSHIGLAARFDKEVGRRIIFHIHPETERAIGCRLHLAALALIFVVGNRGGRQSRHADTAAFLSVELHRTGHDHGPVHLQVTVAPGRFGSRL